MTTAHPLRGHALVVFAAVCFGINGGMSRVPMEAGLSTGSFTAVRLVSAFLLFLLIALAFDRSALAIPRGRQCLLLIALGLFGVALVQWSYNVAITRLPLGLAVLLEYLAPVWVVLWVRFARRVPVHKRVWPGIAVAIVGLSLIGQIWGPVGELDLVGVGAATLGGVCFAAYFLFGEALTTHESSAQSPLHVVVWSFGIGSIAILLFQWPLETLDTLGQPTSMLGTLNSVSLAAWLPMAWSIVFGTVVPFFLYLVALKYLPSSQATVTAMLEPIIAVGVGWLWFEEVLNTWQLIGVLAVLFGIVLAQSGRTDEHEDLPLTT
jgi:drug/metabolite transporter (DMT)-like permease